MNLLKATSLALAFLMISWGWLALTRGG